LDADGVFRSIDPAIRALHGYTHGGLEQLGRRFDAAGNVSPHYSDSEKQEAINATTALFVLLGVTWCQIMGDDGRNPNSGSARIMERYSQIYGHEYSRLA
jgi:hypothetical protein